MKWDTIIENFAALAVVPASLLYFSGYIYLYFFCTYLGIDPSSLHYDLFTVMIYAVNAVLFPLTVALRYWPWTAGCVATIVAIAVLWRWDNGRILRRWRVHSPTAGHFSRPVGLAARAAAVLAAVVLLFLVSEVGGENRAAESLQSKGPAVRFQFTRTFLTASACQPGKSCGYDDLTLANEMWCLHKLIETDNAVIVACQPPDSDAVIYAIPKSAITFEMLQRS